MTNKIHKLGNGAFGNVYLGDHNGVKVAIKRTKINENGIHYSTLREISTYAAISHPNIVSYYHTKYLLRYVEIYIEYWGISLKQYIHSTAFSIRMGCIDKLFKPIISALAYLHHNNIIHRDVKPDNILVQNDIAKLCDLGLCRYHTDNYHEKIDEIDFNNMTREVCTVNYRAPELFSCDYEEYNSSIDVWSLGCVIYEYIMRRYMFPGTKNNLVWNKICATIQPTEEDFDSIDYPSSDNPCPIYWEDVIRNIESPIANIYIPIIRDMVTFNPSRRPALSIYLRERVQKISPAYQLYIGVVSPSVIVSMINYINEQATHLTICNKTVECALCILEEYVKFAAPTYEDLDAMIVIASKIHDLAAVTSKNKNYPKIEKQILNTINFHVRIT